MTPKRRIELLSRAKKRIEESETRGVEVDLATFEYIGQRMSDGGIYGVDDWESVVDRYGSPSLVPTYLIKRAKLRADQCVREMTTDRAIADAQAAGLKGDFRPYVRDFREWGTKLIGQDRDMLPFNLGILYTMSSKTPKMGREQFYSPLLSLVFPSLSPPGDKDERPCALMTYETVYNKRLISIAIARGFKSNITVKE